MFFRDVVGLEALKKQLISRVASQRISHTQLFLGQEGGGGLPLALAFSRYLHCRQRGAEDACGTCPSCLKFNKLAHPDMHFFYPVAPNRPKQKDVSSKTFVAEWREMLLQSAYFPYADWISHLGIENKQAIIHAEDCHEIIRILGLKSFESPYKIVLVWMVEKLYHAAAPKLLKILEEPPDNTLFLLISENREQVLNTILSRAQILKIPPPAEEDIEKALQAQHPLTAQDARQISQLVSGNYAEAVKLAKDAGKARADFELFRQWMRLCFKNNWQQMLGWVEDFSKNNRERQKSFLQFGIRIMRLSMLRNYHADPLIRLLGEERQFIEGFSPFANHHNLPSLVKELQEALFHVERNANPKILFADLSFRLSALFHPFKNQ